MTLTYKFIYKGEFADRLLELCDVSRCLYNQGLYAFKQELKENNNWLFYSALEKLLKKTPNLEGSINYYLLKAQCAQQCLRQLDDDIRSYCRTIKDWKEHKEKYKGMPKMPNFKKEYNQVVFTNQNSSIRDGYLRLYPDMHISIPQWDKFKDRLSRFQQARIIPSVDGRIVVELCYKYEAKTNIGGDKVASIDLGVSNLATLITSDGDAVIFGGGYIKSVNRYANKELAKATSILEKENFVYYKGKDGVEKKKARKTSRKTEMLWRKRNNRIADSMHKISRSIVDLLVDKGIGKLSVGYNRGWKQDSNLGQCTNQAFCQIPFLRFANMLKYKCEMEGIEFVLHEESYTSKCDALALESVGKHDEYLGKRKKRGLFQSSVGKTVNADVNGALNILRKVFGDSPIKGIADSGRLFRPVKCGTDVSRFTNTMRHSA